MSYPVHDPPIPRTRNGSCLIVCSALSKACYRLSRDGIKAIYRSSPWDMACQA